MKKITRLIYLLALVLLFMMIACATPPVKDDASTKVLPSWPAPPAAPRIQWVREIRQPEQLRRQRGFWQRFKEILVGGSRAKLVKPYGLYVDSRQRLFIIDPGSGVVHLLDQADGSYRVIPGPKSTIVFQSPIDMTGDGQGQFYLTDSKAGLIYRYRLEGDTLEKFTGSPLMRPTGIAWHQQNRLLYVAETGRHQVVAFDLQGIERLRFGHHGNAPGQFNFPTAVCVDHRGQVLVTDALNARIQVFTPEGHFVSSFGKPGDTSGTFAKPKGIAVDSEGHIYVCDALFDAVQIFSTSGELLLTFGESGSEPGQFWMPAGIAIDANDFIYVADSYNQRVQVFRYFVGEAPK
jgi:sugar lactone lactonase YvrE